MQGKRMVGVITLGIAPFVCTEIVYLCDTDFKGVEHIHMMKTFVSYCDAMKDISLFSGE
jgi:hypothetical protein